KAHAFMLDKVTPTSGARSVANLKLIVERREAMRQNPEPVGGEEAAKAAEAALVEYGLDAAWFAEIAEQVRIASELPADEEGHEGSADLDADTIQRAKIAHYFWHKGWANIARTTITRRDWLIQLGLASRRSSNPSPSPQPVLT